MDRIKFVHFINYKLFKRSNDMWWRLPNHRALLENSVVNLVGVKLLEKYI